MKLTFDYYHNLENIDLRLCNPDERELFPLPGENRNLVLRFNDLSELTFDVYSTTTLSDGTVVELEAYDYIRTKRLVYATNIGWFQISNVTEEDDGKRKYKGVTAQSYQSIFKNKGFMSEERVYCFYNPNDPYDDRYDSKQADSIPSVLGQMYKQLGIKQVLSQGQEEPAAPYEDWTVTYIPSSLIYGGANSVCRTFKENATFGYDWMVNDVEEAFEVIVLFDFMYKTIHVRLPNSVSEKADVLYTFNGLMKSVEVSENADDIVTVLNCNGDNCDITAVNPTGTNYICDFSYYMDKVNHRWMSAELIAKLERWKADCDAEKPSYASLIQRLRGYYKSQTECETDLQAASLSLQDLKNAQAERGVLGSGTAGSLCGTEAVENVKSGKLSLETASEYCKSPFSGSAVVTAYQNAPTFDENTGGWQFSGASKSGTADSIVADNMASNGSSATTYWYFSDVSDRSSYCKLKSRASVNKDSPSVSYSCDGFDRYIAYRYPIIQEGSGTIVYCDDIHVWISRWERVVAALNSKNTSLQANIDATNSSLSVITNKLNVLSYFSNTPALLRELNCYWIEGDYTNDHIAVLDETTPEEKIDLSNELLSSGYAELSKVCQPRFSFSLESINATKIYEFREQMQALELGKVVTIEKEEGVWYYPALLEISINLDDNNTFNMTFANATRLDDWGYTYADLISTSSSTSRQVSANWQNITAYAKEKEKISSLIKEPLDTTLRASFANMVNQEFSVDQNGVLGRKRLSMGSDTFEKEQVRLINNLLIFTDDEWKTAKTALGKVYYKDDDGNLTTAYGLVAETIIGSLIMGEKLKIKNGANTVEIGENGIAIHKDNGDTVFTVDTSGKINICNNFIVDAKGNIALNGNITWGTGASPTQAVYATSALAKPADGTKWSSFPASGSGWHRDYASTDYFASYTYDGGATWTSAVRVRGEKGSPGEQGYSIVAYVEQSNFTEANWSTYGTIGHVEGWTGTESIANGCRVGDLFAVVGTATDTKNSHTLIYRSDVSSGRLHGTCISHVITPRGAKGDKGDRGSDANVTHENVFNALTNNGTIQGIFEQDNQIYFNGAYIKAHSVTADQINSDELHVNAANIDGTLTAQQIDADNLVVQAANVKGALSSNMIYVPKSHLYSSYTNGGTWIDGSGLRVYNADKTGINYLNFGITYSNIASGISAVILDIGLSTATAHGEWTFDKFIRTPSLQLSGTDAHRVGISSGQLVFFYNDKDIAVMDGQSTYVNLYGTWRANGSAWISGSDARWKNTVEDFTPAHDILFDHLRPRTYKWNEGTSDRTHSGFIVQEVVEAVEKSGLTTKDFAAVVNFKNDNGEDDGWGLRYEELISLNTWQIQKLKESIKRLESEIANLKTEKQE